MVVAANRWSADEDPGQETLITVQYLQRVCGGGREGGRNSGRDSGREGRWWGGGSLLPAMVVCGGVVTCDGESACMLRCLPGGRKQLRGASAVRTARMGGMFSCTNVAIFVVQKSG